MTRGWARWLLRSAAAVAAVSLLTFLMADALPGDMAHRVAAARYDAEHVDAATTARVRAELALDQPAWVRLAHWLEHVARFDAGRSVVTGRPVADELAAPLARSLLLVALSWPVVLGLGTLAGLALARRRAGLVAAQLVGALAAGTPSYVLGLGLGLVFAIRLGWLPVAGHGGAAFLVLPAATLALLGAARLSLVTARAAFAAARHPSVGFARMKGLPRHEVALRHVLPLAAPAVIAYAFVSLAYLLEGAAVVETVFDYPGLGRRLVQAVRERDVPVIEAAGIAVALLVSTANSLADALAGRLGPA